MKKLDDKYLESLSEDIYAYIEERCALDGVNLTQIDPIVISSRSSHYYIGKYEGTKSYKVKGRITIEITDIEREKDE